VDRSTRNITLGLIGSALVFGCCCVSCVDIRDEPERDANGNIVRHHRHVYFHWWPWYHSHYYGSGWGYGGYGGYGRSYAPSPGRTTTGGGSRPSSGATSRGGFGGTGHATAGG